jgi:hypothetical protein
LPALILQPLRKDLRFAQAIERLPNFTERDRRFRGRLG